MKSEPGEIREEIDPKKQGTNTKTAIFKKPAARGVKMTWKCHVSRYDHRARDEAKRQSLSHEVTKERCRLARIEAVHAWQEYVQAPLEDEEDGEDVE